MERDGRETDGGRRGIKVNTGQKKGETAHQLRRLPFLQDRKPGSLLFCRQPEKIVGGYLIVFA